MALLLRGGIVVTAEGETRADVRIEGERIASIGTGIRQQDDEAADVSGCYLLPGGIDAHTHFDLPLGDGTRTADSFETGTRAAVAGGTTTILDYATQFRGETLNEGLANWRRLADGKCHCDYGFHMAVTDWSDAAAEELRGMIAAGVTSFKMYMAYKGSLQVEDAILYRALRELRQIGGLLCVHCENGDIVAERVRDLLLGGLTGPQYHPLSRPEELETEAAERLMTIADLADAPVYIVHVSAERTMRRIAEARAEGQRVYAETCPQYLFLDDALYTEGGFEAAKYVCSPPLRSERNKRGLWAALSSNAVDVVATDHCAFNFAGQKERGRADFSKIPNGMPGVESRLLLMYRGVTGGLITLSQMVCVLSAGPAKRFGMYPRKGTIAPGADADIVVLDPSGRTEISAGTQYQNVDYTPFEGFSIPASIKSVYLRGRKCVENGKFLQEAGEPPRGVFIYRGPSGVEGGWGECMNSI